MRFLADESCDFSVVRALRFAGHPVVAIAEVSPREEDDEVRERAVVANCILITEDKDFGQLVYANMRRTGGVIFIRFPARARRNLADTVVEVVRQRGDRLIGHFTFYNRGECASAEIREAEYQAQGSGVQRGIQRVQNVQAVQSPGSSPGPFKKLRAGARWLVLDFEGFTAAFAGAESEVGSESLVGLFD